MTPLLGTLAVAVLYRMAADLMREPASMASCLVALGWGASLGAFLDLATGY